MKDPLSRNELDVEPIFRYINPNIVFPLSIPRIDEDDSENFNMLISGCSEQINKIFGESRF